MARLTAAQRKKLPASSFAGPGRSFPVNDKSHAEAALRDLPQAKGLTSKQRRTIKLAARAKLGKS